MKTLIIAEKPSLEREIKDMLEAKFGEKFQNKNGYWESDKYLTSCFFGHLLRTYMPEDYGIVGKWKAEDLPIIPEPLKYKYDGDKGNRGRLLAKLAAGCDMLVNCCDPDREGEGIFRTWYEYEGIKTPFKRFWSKSLAQADLAKNWVKLEPSSKYDNLAIAQKLRAEADWLVGMNGSRAYAIAAGSGSNISIGRVQTATLALIVKRDIEVENYKESFFYTLAGQWNQLPFVYFDDNGTKFENEKDLLGIKSECERSVFHLDKFEEQDKIQNPPMPFALNELQKAANVKFGFPLDKTLSIVQSLYEKKLTTYPRTSSSFLPPADIDEYYAVIDRFAEPEEKEILIPKGSTVPCMRESESAHTAIIPTGEMPGTLTEEERMVFNLILTRFIVSFLKPRLYKQITIIITNDKHYFRSVVTKTEEQGYTKGNTLKEENDEENDKEEKEVTFQVSKESLSAPKSIEKLEMLKKIRTKPKYYTPGTLLTAMMHVGRSMDKKEYKEVLNEVAGLGTEATRDAVPVELENRAYIQKSGKYLMSTNKGRQLISWVNPNVKTPELTAEWETKLRDMEKGKYDPRKFREEIHEFTKKLIVIDSALAVKFTSVIDESKRKCPKCKKTLNENQAGFFCIDECGFKMFKLMWGKKLSDKDIDLLFTNGITGVIEGFKKKNKDTYKAYVEMKGPEYKAQTVFEASSEHICPICAVSMKAGTDNIKCDKCKLTVWYEMSEKKLSDSILKTLLIKGRTSVIKGFISAKNGNSFEAALVINKEKKKVDFEFQCSKQ